MIYTNQCLSATFRLLIHGYIIHEPQKNPSIDIEGLSIKNRTLPREEPFMRGYTLLSYSLLLLHSLVSYRTLNSSNKTKATKQIQRD